MFQEAINDLRKLIEAKLVKLKSKRHLSESDVFRVGCGEEAVLLLKRALLDLDDPKKSRVDVDASVARALILAHNARMLGLNNEKGP